MSSRDRVQRLRRVVREAARVGYGAGETSALLLTWFVRHETPPHSLHQIEEELLCQ